MSLQQGLELPEVLGKVHLDHDVEQLASLLRLDHFVLSDQVALKHGPSLFVLKHCQGCP